MTSVIEYIWIGGNQELRSKTRVIHESINSLNDFKWNYDGSSTEQADGTSSEIILLPVASFNNPLFKEEGINSLIFLCETYNPDGTPAKNNTRSEAIEIFNKKIEEEPWYGMEQEYFMINPINDLPIGFKQDGKQGQYYCSVGLENAFGRQIAEDHLKVCLKAGIQISGINAEVAPGQWEFQIGPCTGIDAGDHMIVARYLLLKVAENHGIKIDFSPKPIKGNWNGSGCHTNYSTKNMRDGSKNKNGLEFIEEAILRLADNHEKHMFVYGEGNEKRMTGAHETANYATFTHGIANRGASVRIGNETYNNKKGYFEDRRPSSNFDPYIVSSKIFESTCLQESKEVINMTL